MAIPELESPSFTRVAPYYDRLMRDVPYRSWVSYLHQLLELRTFTPNTVLDLACGTGTVAEILHTRGYRVTGIDLSPGMIEEARRKACRKALEIRYEVQDAGELDLPGEPFDVCVSLFDSLNYIAEPEHLAKAISRVHRHLRPGGLFIFDVNSAFALENGFFDQENTNSNDRLRYVWRSEYDAESRLCRIHMRFFWRAEDGVDREFRETHVQFAYAEEELRAMLESAGFTQIQTFQAYSLQPVRPTTDRIFFLATRP